MVLSRLSRNTQTVPARRKYFVLCISSSTRPFAFLCACSSSSLPLFPLPSLLLPHLFFKISLRMSLSLRILIPGLRIDSFLFSSRSCDPPFSLFQTESSTSSGRPETFPTSKCSSRSSTLPVFLFSYNENKYPQ